MAFPIAALIGIGSQLIEKLIPDPQQKAEATQRLVELQQAGQMKELDAQLSVLVAELSGNFLQRSWRPITMLSFLVLVVCDAFGLLFYSFEINITMRCRHINYNCSFFYHIRKYVEIILV